MLYHFFRILIRIFAFVFLRFKVEGSKNIPLDGPVIIAANHVSFLDPPLMGAAARRDLYFLARESLFKIWGFGSLIRRVHAFPVKPRSLDPSAFKTLFRLIDEGKVILMFPEGTRSRDGLLQKPQPGVGMIVYRTKVPVIPALIIGAHKALPRGSKIIKPARVTIRFGKPVDMEEYFKQDRSKDTYKLITEKIMAEMANLHQRN
jgi:1-acyl-sn-glycerol-3-phosphate acyltransferase